MKIIGIISIFIVCLFFLFYIFSKIKKELEDLSKIQNEKDKINLELLRQKENFNNELDEYKKSKTDQLDNELRLTEIEYKRKKSVYDEELSEIEKKKNYASEKLQIELQSIQDDIDSLKQTRSALDEAIKREDLIKSKLNEYCLVPSDEDLEDIHKLCNIKNSLQKPRILSMLIWQTYFQPLAKKQFITILGNKTVTGIYKITNQKNNKCYIGQARDVYKRWNEHCKCGLGIDTPPGNKLYKAMFEDGLESFSFELLEECNSIDLNKKERFYIETYQADTIGYNSNIGINK